LIRTKRRELIRDMSLRQMELNLILQQMGHADNGGLFGRGRKLRRGINRARYQKFLEIFDFE